MNEQLIRRLSHCTTLPTLPSTAIRIIELANSPDTSLMQIAGTVAFDPALAAKMLKVANSPLYNSRRSASNLRQAINLLGTHAAVTIALSFSVVGGLQANQQGVGKFWQRSILAALACRVLAKHFQLPADDVLLAGLLQDIGILAMQTALGDDHARAIAHAANHDALLAAERAAFGCGHDEVGYWLLKRWRLPEHLALACLASHAQACEGEGRGTNACVALSGYLADVFIAPHDNDAAARLSDAASRCLKLDAAGLAAVVDAMRDGIKEVEELFDVPLIDAAQADALLGEAKELLLIANLRQNRELEERSQRDALTGAHNRAYVDDALTKEFELSNRHGWPLSVAMIDIDHFKQVNDTYGHAVGDAALLSVTRVIQAQIRSGDVFARYGGEEFVLLFPGTPLDESAKVLERIRAAVAAVCHIGDSRTTFKVTISTGLACHIAHEELYSSAHDLMQAADLALYNAKARGRNQLAMAGDAQEE